MNFFLCCFVFWTLFETDHFSAGLVFLSPCGEQKNCWPSLLLLTLSLFLSPPFIFHPTSVDPFTVRVEVAGQCVENEHCKKQRKRKRERADGGDRVKHLIHRKWTEPHKASFLCELAAVGGAAVEKALLIWIKQGLSFNIPRLWVSQVSRPKLFFFLRNFYLLCSSTQLLE